MIIKFLNIVRQVGLWNTILGSIKQIYYWFLQKKYRYYKWNIKPFELREYIQVVAEIINKDQPNSIIDIGCGLGELLRHIHKRSGGIFLGYDLDPASIEVAKVLDKKRKIHFEVGTFDAVSGQSVDYLVTLNFMGGADEEYWKPFYQSFLARNKVKRVIVDVLSEKYGNHHLDFTKVLPEEYQLIIDKGPYMADRHIQVFERYL